jgi:acyl-CoA synthetase (AMP-forming)/AMP-acid ligase II
MGAPIQMALAAVHTPPADQLNMLMPVPLFHVTGLLAQMIRIFVAGSKMIFLRRWSVPDAVKLVVKYNVKMISGVPAITTAILQSGLLPEDYVIDTFSYGGAPPPKRLADDTKKRYPDAFVLHGWGMTEASGLFIAIAGPDCVERVGGTNHAATNKLSSPRVLATPFPSATCASLTWRPASLCRPTSWVSCKSAVAVS